MRDDCGGGADGGEHGACGREVVDVRAVFVGDPEGAVGGQDEAFGVDGHARAAGAGGTEAVAEVVGDG